MIRHLRLLAPALILVAACLPAAAQSEPAALPVTPVPAEPQPEPAPPVVQRAAPPTSAAQTPAPVQTPVAVPADDSKARISKLESELAAARTELKKAKSQASAAGGKARDERAHADAEREKLKAQIATLTAERDRTQSALDQARVNLASAKERLAIYEKTISEGTPPDAAQLQAALAESQQKVDMTVRAFEVVEAENNRIRAQLKDVDPEQLSNELALARQDLADAQRQLTAEKYRSNNLARELVRAKPGTPVVIDETLPSAPTRPSDAEVAAPESPSDEPAGGAKIHTVADGETLSAISKEYYGNANRWIEIFNANRDVLKDENHLTPGTKLRIP